MHPEKFTYHNTSVPSVAINPIDKQGSLSYLFTARKAFFFTSLFSLVRAIL